jgi:hypothetical protein
MGMNLKKNHMATFTLVDEEGNRDRGIRGFVQDINNDEVHYVDVEAAGTCVVPLEQLSNIKAIAKPKTTEEKIAAGLVDRPKVAIAEAAPVNSTKPSKRAAPARKKSNTKEPTKGELCLELLRKNKKQWIGSKEKKAKAIEAFMTELDMGKAGANTYYLKYSKLV